MQQIHKLLIFPATTAFQEEYYTWTEYNCTNSIVLPGKATLELVWDTKYNCKQNSENH